MKRIAQTEDGNIIAELTPDEVELIQSAKAVRQAFADFTDEMLGLKETIDQHVEFARDSMEDDTTPEKPKRPAPKQRKQKVLAKKKVTKKRSQPPLAEAVKESKSGRPTTRVAIAELLKARFIPLKPVEIRKELVPKGYSGSSISFALTNGEEFSRTNDGWTVTGQETRHRCKRHICKNLTPDRGKFCSECNRHIESLEGVDRIKTLERWKQEAA